MVILKTKGKIPLSGVPFSLLLCSLYTLCENNTLFKTFNVMLEKTGIEEERDHHAALFSECRFTH